MKKITKIGLIYTRGGNREILCVKKRGLNVWISPGGKLEPGETHLECLDRELQEELNCSVGQITEKPFMTCCGIAEGTTDVELELIMYRGYMDTMEMRAQNEIEYYVYAPIACYATLPLAWSLKTEILPALHKEYDDE